MIDINKEIQSFKQLDINALETVNPNMSDNVKNSIILYNKAIDNLKTKSEDIAIIELKKAVSLNPEFNEAMHLLGLCYSYTKEYQKAEEIFKKLAMFDDYSMHISKYMSGLKGIKTSNKVEEAVKKDRENEKRASVVDKPKKDTSDVKNVFSLPTRSRPTYLIFIAVFLTGAVVMMLAILPFLAKPRQAQVSNSNADTKKPVENVNKELESKYNKLSEDYKKLHKDLENSNNEADYYKNVNKLLEIEKLLVAKEYEAAADKLVLLNSVGFKDAAKEKYDTLTREVMPKAVMAVFTQGNNLYNSKNYQDAVPKLSKLQSYNTDFQYMALALYQLGMCYKETNDVKNALTVFQTIIEKYPGTEYAGYSQYRIKELKGE